MMFYCELAFPLLFVHITVDICHIISSSIIKKKKLWYSCGWYGSFPPMIHLQLIFSYLSRPLYCIYKCLSLQHGYYNSAMVARCCSQFPKTFSIQQGDFVAGFVSKFPAWFLQVCSEARSPRSHLRPAFLSPLLQESCNLCCHSPTAQLRLQRCSEAAEPVRAHCPLMNNHIFSLVENLQQLCKADINTTIDCASNT